MSGTTFITDLGLSKISLAAGEGPIVEITHVALGDGGGAPYEPTFDQTELINEGARLPIDSRHRVDPKSWNVKVTFPHDGPAVTVREIGFFDQDGDLIVIHAGLGIPLRTTGAVDYLIDHVLDFSRVDDDLIVVTAPDDTLFDLSVATSTSLARLQLEQLKQREIIRATLTRY